MSDSHVRNEGIDDEWTTSFRMGGHETDAAFGIGNDGENQARLGPARTVVGARHVATHRKRVFDRTVMERGDLVRD